jgi:hypothetical protein
MAESWFWSTQVCGTCRFYPCEACTKEGRTVVSKKTPACCFWQILEEVPAR